MKPHSSTQECILDAAETLFARQGIANTSLRSITKTAGVNAAAIHYHFGSKRALVVEIMTRRSVPDSEARLARLERLEQTHRSGAIPAERLVEAYVGPLGATPRWPHLGMPRLAVLLDWLEAGQGDDPSRVLAGRLIEVNERFAAVLCRGRSLDLDEARDRIHYAAGAIAQLLEQEPTPRSGVPNSGDAQGEIDALRDRLSHLVRFLGAGLAAPPTRDEVKPMKDHVEVSLAVGGHRP